MSAAHAPPQIEDVVAGDLKDLCRWVVASGQRMQMAYAWFPDAADPSAPEVRYVVHAGNAPLSIWRCRAAGRELPSLAAISPLLSWYEREMTDLCGITFHDSPDAAPLVLLPGGEVSPPPLVPGAATAVRYQPQLPGLPEITGPSSKFVQRLPFGPIRAGVLESAHFSFLYLGEAILHYHPQLFLKHRGMEKRFEGLPANLGTVLAERVSGIGSVAHALAYCQAVEAAADCEVPPRARRLRLVLAELERLYNHLHYLGHLAHTTTLKVGEAQGKLLEEQAKQLNARICGHRLLRGIISPGGVRRDLDLSGLARMLAGLAREFGEYASMLETSTTHLDRLITTGRLSRRLAFDQGATGPVERASGLDRDLRRDQPYAAYPEVIPTIATWEAGDAHARQQVRIDEINNSIDLVERALDEFPPGPLRAPCVAPPGAEGLGWAESPRGSLYYAVHFDQAGALARVKIKSPSFSNWRAFSFTVHDSNMMDYAINEASFGLSIAGCDR